jgi:hypothetical protein
MQTVSTAGANALKVRISQHAAEDFWRVEFEEAGPCPAGRAHMSTTVAAGDSFMMHLILGAMSGEQVAWRHLAHWGQDNLGQPARTSGLHLA